MALRRAKHVGVLHLPQTENCALQGYYAAGTVNFLSTFRELSVHAAGTVNFLSTFRGNLSVPSSGVKN